MSKAATSDNLVHFGIRFKRDYFNDSHYVNAVVRKQSTKKVTEYRTSPTDLATPKCWKQRRVALRNMVDIINHLERPQEHFELVKLVCIGGLWKEIK